MPDKELCLREALAVWPECRPPGLRWRGRESDEEGGMRWQSAAGEAGANREQLGRLGRSEWGSRRVGPGCFI